MEISNTRLPIVWACAGEGIARVVFFEAGEIWESSYPAKKGKYQPQPKITLLKI